MVESTQGGAHNFSIIGVWITPYCTMLHYCITIGAHYDIQVGGSPLTVQCFVTALPLGPTMTFRWGDHPLLYNASLLHYHWGPL